MTHSFFWLRHLRVVRRGVAVYDQSFHTGVNIIRGENGSGKSTIADFIFYVLGGEFDNWKKAALECDEVQAEVVTKEGVLVLRRAVDRAQTPLEVFYGPMEDAEHHGLDGWHRFSIRRTSGSLSFTQVMFRAAGIPEAQSQGASNITMHQILRLLYSDQRTPAGFLYRYEDFDPREIREAVGDLVCGIGGYELYEIELHLRELGKTFDEKSRELSVLLASLPREQIIVRVEEIDTQLNRLSKEYDGALEDITNVAELVPDGQVQGFLNQRAEASHNLRKLRGGIGRVEERAQMTELEIVELKNFLHYLEDLSDKLPRAEAAAEIIGNIDFTHCPACLTPLSRDKGADHCIVCGTATDPEKERSRYLQIKTDLDIQIRESKQLLDSKESLLKRDNHELRVDRRNYHDLLSEYTVKFEISTSPRESFVAQRNQRIGQIDREKAGLERLRERVEEIEKTSGEKEKLQLEITRLEERQDALDRLRQRRKSEALTKVSVIGREVLHNDLVRQAEFINADAVSLNFADNSIKVDGELNFAESSNVVLKNTATLALLLAATTDARFYHPRFALFDNIEDKGMEQARSHNFQRVMIEASNAATMQHQIILTTSTINPEFDDAKYVIGPPYTKQDHTLQLGFEV